MDHVKHHSLRRVTAIGLLLLLAACGGSPERPSEADTGAATPSALRKPGKVVQKRGGGYYKDDGPADEIPDDLDRIPDAEPRLEPLHRFANNPYVVLGRSYVPNTSLKPIRQRGIASWYGKKFHGQKTSIGETYDMFAMTAAHPTLALPSYARVTNLTNGKSVVVRVTDRGPFHADRIIDLSYAAAVRIGIWPAGTGLVEVRAIDPALPQREPPPIRQVRSGKSPEIFLQVGSYSDARNAQRVADAARRAGIRDVSIVSASVGGRTVHRVRVGPLPDAASADAMSPRLAQLGFGTPRVAIER